MNASASAKNTIIGWGMPDYSSNSVITVNITTSMATDELLITAPCDGYVVARITGINTIAKLWIAVKENNTTVATFSNSNPAMGSGNSSPSSVSFPIAKGQKVHLDGDLVSNTWGTAKFYPMKGV